MDNDSNANLFDNIDFDKTITDIEKELNDTYDNMIKNMIKSKLAEKLVKNG